MYILPPDLRKAEYDKYTFFFLTFHSYYNLKHIRLSSQGLCCMLCGVSTTIHLKHLTVAV